MNVYGTSAVVLGENQERNLGGMSASGRTVHRDFRSAAGACPPSPRLPAD